MEEKKETFTFTYSASQQEEVKRIREKYAPATEQEDKMERLRRLDRAATKPGTVAALIVGTIDTLFIPGIIIGVVGIIGICAAYPLYLHITKKRRDKLAPEIMHLADELMK